MISLGETPTAGFARTALSGIRGQWIAAGLRGGPSKSRRLSQDKVVRIHERFEALKRSWLRRTSSGGPPASARGEVPAWFLSLVLDDVVRAQSSANAARALVPS
jgi:hypothetical protein